MVRLLSALIIVFPSFLFAQDGLQEKKGVVYHDEFSLGFTVSTNGWRIFGEKGKQLSIYKRRLIRIGLSEILDVKESKQASLHSANKNTGTEENPRPYFFGKQNTLY